MSELIELKLYDDNCPAIQNLLDTFNINEIPEYKRNLMWKSYVTSFLTSQYDYNPDIKKVLRESKELHENKKIARRVLPVKEVAKRLSGTIDGLETEQFKTVSHNGIDSVQINDVPNFWIQPIATYIPDADEMNIHIIDDKMEGYGYIRVRTTEQYEKNGRKWYFLIYNPDSRFMPDVRSMLRKASLVHYAPEKFHDDILEDGLIPSRGGRTYLYPNERVFFYIREPNGVLDDDFIKMMCGISRKERRKDPMMSNIFDCWKLLMNKVPEEAKVYYDPNAEECVYLTIHIELEWLEYMSYWYEEF